MSTDRQWRVGDTIADLYEVRGINTEGGMAVVHFVWHTQWQMELVIKSPRPELLADAAARDRFVAEAETWVTLGLHPNIVTAYYVREILGFPRIVIEKMEGGSLKQWLRDGKVRDLATALDLGIQVAEGLAFAEKRQPGFVHRDVKPANVLMTPEGEAKVTDFGLVGAIGARVGTPAYMAPEVWTNPEGVTPAADLYAYGVLLYELLTGRRPFERGDAGESLGGIRGGGGAGGSLGALRLAAPGAPGLGTVSIGARHAIEAVEDPSLGGLTSADQTSRAIRDDVAFYSRAHLEDQPESPRRFNDAVTEPLERLAMSLLSKDPSGRPRNAGDVAGALRDVYAGLVGQRYAREPPKEASLRADGLNNRALSFIDLGKARQALAVLDEALASSPAHPEAEYNRATLSWREGEATDLEAVERLEHLARTAPDDWCRWHLLGLLHVARRDRAGARQALGRAREASAVAEVDEALGEVDRAGGAWADATGEPVALPLGPFGVLTAAAISADGTTVLASGEMEAGGILGVWSAADRQSMRTLRGHQGAPSAVAVSGDGSLGLSGGRDPAHLLLPGRTPPRDYALRVWDLATGANASVMSGHTAHVRAVVLSRSGRTAVSAGADGRIGIWNMQRRTLERWLTGHEGQVTSVAFVERDRRVVSGGADGTVRVWNIVTGKGLILRAHSGWVRSVAVSPDSKRLLSAGDDGLRLWNLDDGECVRAFGKGGAVGFFDDDHAYSCWSDGRGKGFIGIWQIGTGGCIRTVVCDQSEAGTLARLVEPTGALLSAGRRSVRFWNPGPLEPPSRRFVLSRVTRSAIAIGRKAEALAATARVGLSEGRWDAAAAALSEARQLSGYDRDADLLDLWHRLALKGTRARLRASWQTGAAECAEYPRALAISDDGSIVASGHTNGVLRLWNRRGRCLQELEGQRWHSDVLAVAVSGDGAHAVSAGADRALHLWRVESGERLGVLEGHRREIGSIGLSRDGQVLLSVGVRGPVAASPSFVGGLKKSGERVVRLWDLPTRSCLRTVDLDFLHDDETFALEDAHVLSGGRFLLARSKDRRRRLWDLGKGAILDLGQTFGPVPVAASPTGRLLLVGNRRVAQILRVSDGSVVGEVVTHAADVEAVAWFPDEQFVLVNGATTRMGDGVVTEGEVGVWNVETGQCEGVLAGHAGSVRHLAVSADGRFAVSAGEDRTVRFWELDWDFTLRAETVWHDAARPWLEAFLLDRTPYGSAHEDGSQRALVRSGTPVWSESDLESALTFLGRAGFGWVSADGVRAEAARLRDARGHSHA